jgi:HAD superfamily hydrolase (TIGR01456 family)
MIGFAFRTTIVKRKRFMPPWERDGKTADQFFAGVFSSNNPVQRMRRDDRRRQDAAEAAEVAQAEIDLEIERQQLAVDEAFAKQQAEEAIKQQFLPYGAAPRSYFSTSQMPAWGVYQSALAKATSSYSDSTKQLLHNDINSKIPYRYDALPALGSNSSPVWPLHGTAGVVLDIDGVVLLGKEIIEGSDEAVRQMTALRIPFLLMTNGGGKTEADKAKELSDILQCDIHADQVLLAHTPMSLLAPRYENEIVLIGGPPASVEVAKGYGFKRAKSFLQFQAEHPELVPLRKWHAGEPAPAKALTLPYQPVGAMFQFADAYDSFSDIQVALDVLTSPYGLVGGGAVSGTQTVPFYFGADDLVYAGQATLPRLGGGAYREMLSAVYESVTGENLHITPFGKPRAIAYAFAEQRLKVLSERLGWDPSSLRSISMVGDNLDTDIIGANARGGPWLSVQVLSGIGNAQAATRTLSRDDMEMEWLGRSVSRTPHYIAPTLDHYLRELLAFPESHVCLNKKPYFGPPCPVDLYSQYNLEL